MRAKGRRFARSAATDLVTRWLLSKSAFASNAMARSCILVAETDSNNTGGGLSPGIFSNVFLTWASFSSIKDCRTQGGMVRTAATLPRLRAVPTNGEKGGLRGVPSSLSAPLLSDSSTCSTCASSISVSMLNNSCSSTDPI